MCKVLTGIQISQNKTFVQIPVVQYSITLVPVQALLKKRILKSKIGLPIHVSKTTVKYLLLVLYEKLYST